MKEFTKDDLKAGMVVKLRKGEFYMALPYEKGLTLISFDAGWQNLKNYTCDLKDVDGEKEWDVTRVYGLPCHQGDAQLDKSCVENRPVLWEECKEMTLSEIEKELGYKIKILDDNDCYYIVQNG